LSGARRQQVGQLPAQLLEALQLRESKLIFRAVRVSRVTRPVDGFSVAGGRWAQSS